jgi:ribosomal protein L37E
MHLSGFIPTNTEPVADDIRAQCHKCGFEAVGRKRKKYNGQVLLVEYQNITVDLLLLPNGIKYKSFVPELSGYVFISIIAVILLFRVIPVGIWSLLLLFVPALLVGIRVFYDKRVYRFVDSLIPPHYKFLPEMATGEHVKWISDPNVCPACGTERNKYSEKCTSCGLALDKIKTKTNNLSHTGKGQIIINYCNKT